jgi:PAS domain S-box-containing protein
LHLISDIATGLAYFSIPVFLVMFVLRRRDLAYPWVFGLFALFIIACGSTHLMHAWTIFRPAYETEGLIKAITAAVSVATAIVLWPLLPRLLALPSPEAMAREVEERRAAEARAVASEARIAAFIENLAEALFVVGVEPDGFRMQTVNPAFEKLFGLKAVTITEQPVADVIPHAMLAAALPHWREAVKVLHPVEYTIEAETPLGLRVWQTVLVPMTDSSGKVERLLGSARDITMTRRLQTDLLQSARLATVGSMCAGLAHETSQPLNAAMLWLRSARAAASTLAPVSRTEKLTNALGVVEGQLRRAGDLVTRIRALPGEDTGVTQVFDAAAAASAAARTAAGQYAEDGIEVALRAQASLLPVRGGAAQLERALLQLLANARDAVLDRRSTEPEAPAAILVTLRAEPGEAVIEVQDSGAGFPDRLRDAIFDPFFTTRDPGHGSGLGLPLAAAVARGMGGRIEARNLPGGGALFTMRLALAPETSLPAVKEAAPS